MNRQQISDLLDEGDKLSRDEISRMLEDSTGISQPQDSGQQNDVLPSEFQIPGGFDPEMKQAMTDEFGFNAQQKQAQDQQAVEMQQAQEQEQMAMQREQAAKQKQMRADEQQRLGERPLMTRLSDFPAAVNAEVFSALGIPGSVWETVGEMLDVEAMQNTGMTSKDMRGYASKIGVSYTDENTPNSAGTKMGTFVVQGIEFLLPFLKFGRALGATAPATKAVLNKTKAAGKSFSVKSTQSLPSRIAGDIAAPFADNAAKAWATEGLASLGSGYAAHELGQVFGPTGEMYGGAIGGVAPQIGMAVGKRGVEGMLRAKSSFAKFGAEITEVDYTKTIAGKKASDFIQSISGKEDVSVNVKQNEIQTLPQAELSGAKMTGDEHMLTLEQKAMADDPTLFDKLEGMQRRTNELAEAEMQKLGGNVRIEETQAFIEGNIRKTELLLDSQVKQAVINSKQALEPLSTSEEIGSVNRVVREHIEKAKTVAKDIESAKWKAVSPNITITTGNTKQRYRKLIAEQEALKSSDAADVPKFVSKMLGYNKVTKKKGVTTKKYIHGEYDESESLLDLKQFRTRISDEIGKSESKTQKRFLTRLRESVTEDMDTATGSGVKEAISASKYVHDTFEGDIMTTIFKTDKFSNPLDDALTLSKLTTAGKQGLAASVKLKKLLTAAPESYDQLEALVKIQLANSAVLKNKDGEVRVNIDAAQKYLKNNKEVLDIFPKVREELNHAVGQEQRYIGTKGNVDARLKSMSELTEAKYRTSKRKPGQVLPEILSSHYPEREMALVLSKSNKTGRRGIKNAVVRKMMDDSGMDGDDLAKTWADNKKVYGQAFNKYEVMRLEKIIKTLQLNKGSRKKAEIGDILPVENLLISLAMKVAGLKVGAFIGRQTGSQLAATAGTMRYANKLSQWMDSGRAKELLQKAIGDPELFKILTVPQRYLKPKQLQKLMGYQLATVVNEYDEDQQLEQTQ